MHKQVAIHLTTAVHLFRRRSLNSCGSERKNKKRGAEKENKFFSQSCRKAALNRGIQGETKPPFPAAFQVVQELDSACPPKPRQQIEARCSDNTEHLAFSPAPFRTH